MKKRTIFPAAAGLILTAGLALVGIFTYRSSRETVKSSEGADARADSVVQTLDHAIETGSTELSSVSETNGQKKEEKNLTEQETSVQKPAGHETADSKYDPAIPQTESDRESSDHTGSLPETEMASGKDEEKEMSPSRIIFLGDSRTVGMAGAEADQADDCIYIGMSGEGLDWFLEDGYGKLWEAVRDNPGLPVVTNLGVNDLWYISEYLDTYASLIREFPDTHFYFMSVNPVEKSEVVSNEGIEEFNNQLKKAYPDAFIDTYHWMVRKKFKTVDGLHYPKEWYRAIHDYAVRAVAKMETDR